MRQTLKRFGLAVLSVVFLLDASVAQDDPQFTQYFNNLLFYNPGYSGLATVDGKPVTQLSLTHRSQWATYTSDFDLNRAPTTQVLSFNTALPRFKSGIGANLVVDQLGPITNLELQLSYAYHVHVSDRTILSLGVRGAFLNQSVNKGELRPRDPGDGVIGELEGRESFSVPDLAVGVYLQSERYFLGVSTNRLSGASFDYGEGLEESLPKNIYFLAGYHLFLGPRQTWKVTPSVLVKTNEFNEVSYDVGARLAYDEKIWGGASFRNEESANFMVGFNIPRRTRKRKLHYIGISYSFDYVFNGQDAKEPTSHEINLAYTLPIKLPKIPAIIRSVRYKHD